MAIRKTFPKFLANLQSIFEIRGKTENNEIYASASADQEKPKWSHSTE